MSDPSNEILDRPIRDLNLSIAGSRLEPIVDEFLREVRAVGLEKVAPTLYLSTEWGVPDGTIAVAIPFYLASAELSDWHEAQAGHLEGRDAADILRYLRHEMGHVVNYAYLLFRSPEWERLFGAMTTPYREDYRPSPFSRDFVRHLPGWYAQKHPDEDWAETFAVWMTPGLDWRSEYADWPQALSKLDFCDATMRAVSGREPLITSADRDEDVSEVSYSLNDFYAGLRVADTPPPSGIDGSLRAIFEDRSASTTGARRASALIREHSAIIAAEVFRWTGVFPEATRPILLHLADRAEVLDKVYRLDRERSTLVALTAMVTALALHDREP